MLKCTFLVGLLLGAVAARGQVQSTQVELANLREDLRGVSQRVAEMSLRIEQLERQNGELRAKLSETTPAYATLAQLNDAVVELRHAINAGDANTSEFTSRCRKASSARRCG